MDCEPSKSCDRPGRRGALVALFAVSFYALISLIHLPVRAGGGGNFQIRGGGTPTLTNAIGGSISGGSFNQRPFSVTVNFGELGPSNQNGVVSAVIPIQLLSDRNYVLKAQVTANTFVLSDSESIQASDIGFGLQNIRAAGNGGGLKDNPTPVTNSVIVAAFNNDPRTAINLTPLRATFPNTLTSISNLTQIMSGPQITDDRSLPSNCTNCGIIVDAIFAVKPQYFTPGSVSVTVTFTISN